MEQQLLNQKILEELKQIKIDINIVKNKLDNEDSILTEEEEELLEKSYESENNNELISSKDLKKELEI